MRSEPAIPRVLIADDQPDVLEALRLLLKGEGYKMESAGSPAAILEAIDGDEFDAVLMDLNYARDTTSGQEGLDLLSQLRARDATLPVVVMTAWGSVNVAVEAMRRGARDFIQKPWENARLLTIVRTQIELGQALRKGQRLEAENQLLRDEDRPRLIAESPAMQPILQIIERVGPSKTRRVNVRILSATNASINDEVNAGRFRQDLLFRLNTVEIRLPPLRDRREDIPLLANYFLRQHSQRYRKRLAGFDDAAT